MQTQIIGSADCAWVTNSQIIGSADWLQNRWNIGQWSVLIATCGHGGDMGPYSLHITLFCQEVHNIGERVPFGTTIGGLKFQTDSSSFIAYILRAVLIIIYFSISILEVKFPLH